VPCLHRASPAWRDESQPNTVKAKRIGANKITGRLRRLTFLGRITFFIPIKAFWLNYTHCWGHFRLIEAGHLVICCFRRRVGIFFLTYYLSSIRPLRRDATEDEAMDSQEMQRYQSAKSSCSNHWWGAGLVVDDESFRNESRLRISRITATCVGFNRLPLFLHLFIGQHGTEWWRWMGGRGRRVGVTWGRGEDGATYVNGQRINSLSQCDPDFSLFTYLGLRSPGLTLLKRKQETQLSQRDCAAGCVIVFAKSRRLELGDNILRTL